MRETVQLGKRTYYEKKNVKGSNDENVRSIYVTNFSFIITIFKKFEQRVLFRSNLFFFYIILNNGHLVFILRSFVTQNNN